MAGWWEREDKSTEEVAAGLETRDEAKREDRKRRAR